MYKYPKTVVDFITEKESEGCNLFIESEDENTVLSISVTDETNEQSRAEIMASIVAFYSRPLLEMTRKELVDLQAVIIGKSN